MTAIVLHIVIGYIMAFLGLLSPGLLTMTTLNTAVDRGKKQAVLFAFGAVVPIVIQAHIALLGAEYFKNHLNVLRSFSGLAVIVFWVLAFVFYKQYRQRKQLVNSFSFDIHNSFVYGLFISTINPLAIPFYFSYSTLLELQGVLLLHQPFVSLFVIGAVLGALSILLIYARNAKRLLSRVQFLAKYFKLILALIMFGLGLVSLLHYIRVY